MAPQNQLSQRVMDLINESVTTFFVEQPLALPCLLITGLLRVFSRPGQSQRLLYKQPRNNLIKWVSHHFPPTALWRHHAQTIRDISSSYKLCHITRAIATPTVGNPVVAQALELIHLAVVNARLMNHMQNKHKKLSITIISLSVKYVIYYLHANKISVDTWRPSMIPQKNRMDPWKALKYKRK